MNPLAPFKTILSSLKGRSYRKYIKRCVPIVKEINSLEVEYQNLSDDELRAKTPEFMERFQKGETLEQLLPEAFPPPLPSLLLQIPSMFQISTTWG